MQRIHGFTLVELMVTVAVVAILSTIAVPSFQSVIQNNRASSVTNQIVTALNLARSEAVRRGQPVSVCTTNWNQGWRVEVGTNCNATGDNLLRVWEAPHSSMVINSGNTNTISFGSLGSRENSNEVTITVHVQNCSGDRQRTLSIAPGGRVSANRSDCPS